MNVATYYVRTTFIHQGSLMGHTSVNVDFINKVGLLRKNKMYRPCVG